MAEIRVNSTGGVKLYDADDSHYAQIKAGTVTSNTDVLELGSGAVVAGTKVDLNGQELILDADADTSITADTDDQIDVRIAGADDFQFTANTFTAQSGSSIVVPDGGLTFGSTAISSTAAELNILDGVTSTTAELNILDGVTSTTAELNILDGVTATAAEINLIDGGTARGTTAIADGDGVLINDDGTMRMTNVTTLKTYMAGETNTPGWLATMDGAQSISNATYTTVEFDTESDGYDTDSGFNTGTYTYTVPSGEGGKYFLTAGVYMHSNSNHEYGIKFVTSAGDRGEIFIAGINRDVGVVPATTTIQSLNAGQTVYVQVYQNTNASKNTSYGMKNCWFGGFKISS